jgi:hypothetical protein
MVCATITTDFEVVRFPERRIWALSAEGAFLVIPIVALALLRAFPQRSLGIAIAATNLLGLILNANHAVVGAQVATSIWTLTAMMGYPPRYSRGDGVRRPWRRSV